jgi:hypothetical protein
MPLNQGLEGLIDALIEDQDIPGFRFANWPIGIVTEPSSTDKSALNWRTSLPLPLGFSERPPRLWPARGLEEPGSHSYTTIQGI